jgi:hypothetical protein
MVLEFSGHHVPQDRDSQPVVIFRAPFNDG